MPLGSAGMGVMRRMTEEQLERIRWKGEAAFRVLSYYFTIRWNRKRIGDYIQRVLGQFAVPRDLNEERNPPTPGLPASYSLVDLGAPENRDRFRLLYAEQEMFTTDHPGAMLEHLMWHINSETFRGTGNFLLIHAGSVVSPMGTGVLLPGVSGAGKTTLTAALVEAGFGYLSDEAGVIDPVTRRLYPFPRALSFKTGSPSDLPLLRRLRAKHDGADLMKKEWHLPPDRIRPGAVSGPCEIGLIVTHRYEERAETRLTRASPAAAAFDLATHALNMGLYGARALPLVAEVARRARAYHLVSGDLDEAVKTVTTLAGRARPGPTA